MKKGAASGLRGGMSQILARRREFLGAPHPGGGLGSLSFPNSMMLFFPNTGAECACCAKGRGGPHIFRLHVTVVESPFVAFGYESLQWSHVFVYVFCLRMGGFGSSWHRRRVAQGTASALDPRILGSSASEDPRVQCIRAGAAGGGESCSSSVHPRRRQSSWGGPGEGGFTPSTARRPTRRTNWQSSSSLVHTRRRALSL
jgi:hypothetical protein